MYIKIWNIWWDRCDGDEKLLKKCKTLYDNHIKEHPVVENKGVVQKAKDCCIKLLNS